MNRTWINIFVSWQALGVIFYFFILNFEMKSVKLHSFLSQLHHNSVKENLQKKRCEEVSSGFTIEIQVYWKLEMVVVNHTLAFV